MCAGRRLALLAWHFQGEDLPWPKDAYGMVKRSVKEAARYARAGHGTGAKFSEEEEEQTASGALLMYSGVCLLA